MQYQFNQNTNTRTCTNVHTNRQIGGGYNLGSWISTSQISTNIKHNNIQYISFKKARILQSYCIGLHNIIKDFIVLCPPPVDASLFSCASLSHTHSSTVYCSLLHHKQTEACTQIDINTLTHLSFADPFQKKCLNFPHSHFHRAPYLTVGRERNKQQRAASASLSDLKFIKYIKLGPAPSGNICNPKLCLLLLPPASSCHKHST